MPYPRLSPVFNNCAVHALTPEICAEVAKYAANADFNNQHNPEYQRLKDVFATFYRYDQARFTWQEFSDTLNFYNPFDKQLVLGPVLRLFMKGSMTADARDEESFIRVLALGADVSVEDYIDHYTETRHGPNGRYRTVAPDELFTFIAKPLGLSVEYHPQQGGARESLADNPVGQVRIYHSGDTAGTASGHWEREADKATCTDYEHAADTRLTCIMPLLGECEFLNQYGIKLLREHVALVAPGYAEPQNIALTSAQISKYLLAVNYVPSGLAIELVGGNLTDDTQRFIDDYAEFMPIGRMQIFENHLRMPSAFRSQFKLNAQEAGPMAALLAGLSQQQIDALANRDSIAVLGRTARARVDRAIRSIRAARVDLGDGGVDAIGARADNRIADLTEQFSDVVEDLRILGKPISKYPHLQIVLDKKVNEIRKAALEQQRPALLDELHFDAYLFRFAELAATLENEGASTAAQTFIQTLEEARNRFLEEDITLVDGKRILREACEAAVDAAGLQLREHPGWRAIFAQFIRNIGVVLGQGIRNGWARMFGVAPVVPVVDDAEVEDIGLDDEPEEVDNLGNSFEEVLDRFEEDIVRGPGLR